jgi:glycosyltransferase involved in cell wall biosynthesis
MKIGINLLSIVTGGAEIYAINLVKNLALIDKENLYEIFVPLCKSDQFGIKQDNFHFIKLSSKFYLPYCRIVWEQVFLPFIARKHGIDILLSTGNADILFSPSRTIVTFQVIQPFTVPEMYPSKIKLFYLRTMMKLSARTAEKIITVSNTTKNELVKYLKISPSKIASIYHGVDINPLKVASSEDIKKEFGITDDYILSISSVYRFKNYVNLIKGFGILRKKYNQNYLLVIAGKFIERAYYSLMLKTIDDLGLKQQIILINGISHDKTRLLYSAARLYVFPSYSETFGLTQIEAMACGIPVAASNTSVMPEVCSDAAIYFVPSSPEDIAEKMNQVLSDSDMRNGLIKNGFERAKYFSWEKSAKQHLAVFEEVYRAAK